MNNYIVTFEYRVMVTAFAILAMFKGLLPQAFARDVLVEFTILMDLHMCHLLLVFEVHSTAQRLPHPRDVEVFFNLFCRPPKYHVQ